MHFLISHSRHIRYISNATYYVILQWKVPLSSETKLSDIVNHELMQCSISKLMYTNARRQELNVNPEFSESKFVLFLL